MKKKHKLKIKGEIKMFSEKFVKYTSKLLASFEKVQPDIRKAMPSIMNSKNIKIEAYYSEDRKHIMILFEEDVKSSFDFVITKGNITDLLDNNGAWSRLKSSAIRIENSKDVSISGCGIVGIKPFEIVGEKIKILISDLFLDLPNGKSKVVQFGFIFSYSVFLEVSKRINDYVQNIIFSRWDYYRTNNKEKLNTQNIKKYKNNINDLLIKMNELFFMKENEEEIIDNFLTKNPIILEKCLDIKSDSLLPQTTLKNWVQENFTQDMKPDLICQNVYNDWVIIDYKRAKRITKKEKTARADVVAEVHDLKTQLTNYRKYFNEEKHRKSFFKKTGHNIPSGPLAKGIIGNVPEENRKLFLNSIDDYPNWIRIITYNEIYIKFKKYSEELM